MIEKISNILFDMIAAFHKFSRSLLLTDKETGKLNENGDKLKRTFKGIFAIFDILTTIVGGPLKIAFKVLSKILSAFGFNILDITAIIGDAIVKFRDWINKTLDFTKVFKFIAPYVKKAVDAIREWIAETKPLEKAGEIFTRLGSKIKDAFIKIKDSKFGQVAKNIILGLINGLKEGIPTVAKTVWNIGKTIITKICEILGIHSPSTEFIEIGKNIMAGLIVGIMSIKVLSVVSNIAKAIGGLGSVLDGVGDVLSGTGKILSKSASGINKILKSTSKVVKSFAKTLGSVGNLINAKALQTVAISIAILAGSVAVLALMDPGKVWSAVGVIVVLAGVLGGLMAAIQKFGGDSPKGIKEAVTGVKEFGKLSSALLAISGSLLLMAISIKILGGMEWSEFGVAAAGIGLFVVFLAGMVTSIILIKKFGGKKAIDDLGETAKSIGVMMLLFAIALKVIGTMEWSEFGVAAAGMGVFIVFLLAMAGVTIAMSKWGGKKVINDFKSIISSISKTMLIFAIALKLMGSMDWDEFKVAAAGIGLFTGLIIVLAATIVAVNKIGGKKAVDDLGKTILSIAGAMAILTIVAKIIAGMEDDAMIKAAVGLVGLVEIIRMLIKAVNMAGPKPETIGKTLLAISGAMLILAFTAKIIATMEWDAIGKAAVGLTGLALIIQMLIKTVTNAGPNAPKIALTLLALSAAIGILAGVAVLLSLVEIGALAKGIAAIGFLSLFMRGLIEATKGATDCMENLTAITIAVAVIAAAVVALSFIETDKLIGATIALGALMGIFAIILAVAGKSNASMKPLLAMSAAIVVIAAALFVLAKLPAKSLKSASIALIAIAGALLIVSAAAAIVQSVAPGALQGLIIAAAALGIAVLATAIGVSIFAKAFDALATAIKTGGTVVIGFIIQLVSLIPFFASQIGIGLVMMFKSIADSASALCEALTVIVLSAIDALVTIIPAIAEGVFKLIVSLLEILIQYLPQIVPLLVTLFVKLIDLIIGYLPTIVETVFRFIGALLDAVASNISRIIDPLVKLLGSIFQGVANVLGPIMQTLIAPLLTIFKDLIVGIVEAIAPYIPDILNSVEKISTIICDAIVKITETIAPYIPEITAMVETIVNAFVSIVEQISPIIDSISKLIETLGTAITDILGAATEVIKGFGDAVRNSLDGVSGVFDSALGGVADIIESVGGTIKDFLEGIEDVINSVGDAIKKFFDGLANVIEAVGDAALDAGTGFEKVANGVKTITNLKLDDMVKSLSAVTKELSEMVVYADDVATVGRGMKNIAESAKSIKNIFGKISSDLSTVIYKCLHLLVPAASGAMNGFINIMTDASTKLSNISTTMVESTYSIVKETASIAEQCANKVKGFAWQFTIAGQYLMQGLATGIIVNKWIVIRAAQNVAKSVEEIIRSAWQINSPSKLFYKIALGVGEGMIKAFDNSTSSVSASADDLANTATNGFSNAIQKIAEFVNSDMDTQPTIRPVLDLSDVKAGASSISSLFSGNRTLAVSAPGLGAISASMSSRQNGNNDLASAINKLAKSNNKSGDTYQINGISYSEGSDVAGAIQTLVRAAKMEGRT
jgi:phage-related protein